MLYLGFALSGWKCRMMVENSDVNSFRNCCCWLLSDQAVPPQPAFIPRLSQVASACGQLPCLQVKWRSVPRGSFVTLNMSCLLLVQRNGMVKVNIPKLPPAHAWWESVLLSPHPWLQHESWPVITSVEGVTQEVTYLSSSFPAVEASLTMKNLDCQGSKNLRTAGPLGNPSCGSCR